MALIRTLTISTTTFERMNEKFYGFRQTEQYQFFNLVHIVFERTLEKVKFVLWSFNSFCHKQTSWQESSVFKYFYLTKQPHVSAF